MRVPISSAQSVAIMNTKGRVLGCMITNASGTDVFVSDDQRQLDTVDQANLPQVGHRFPANQTLPIVIPFFNGILYARSQTPTQLEVTPFEISACTC